MNTSQTWTTGRGPNGRTASRSPRRELARQLGAFNILSGSVRLDDGRTPKGYKREDFEEAFEQYIPAEEGKGGFKVQHRHHAITTGIVALFKTPQATTTWRFQNRRNPITTGIVAVWRFQTRNPAPRA